MYLTIMKTNAITPEPLKSAREGGTHRFPKRTLLAIKSLAGLFAVYFCFFNNFQDHVSSKSSPLVVLDDKSSNDFQSIDQSVLIVNNLKGADNTDDTDSIQAAVQIHSNNLTIELNDDANPKQYANETATTTTALNKQPHLWIDAITYAEGIAGWKISLLELLFLVQKVGDGATLVEPCMSSGRLGSCAPRYESRGIPISEIFDLGNYMNATSTDGHYPVLVSYDDYQKAIGNTTARIGMAKVCMAHNKDRVAKHCTKDTTWIMDMKQNRLQRMLDKSNQKHFILHLENYWRGGVYELGWQLGMYIPDDKEERFVKGMEIPKRQVFESKTIPFHPNHVQLVDDLLERANITSNNFSAIHWRAEKSGMDFMQCAEAMNEAKKIMLREMTATKNITKEESSQHSFVLMSSLNEDLDMMWSGSRNKIKNRTESSQHALQYLLHDNGFIKIDGLLEMQAKTVLHNEPGMLAIYDLIIASKAYNFATCARDGKFGCDKATRRLCEACNHVGKFGRLASSLRKQSLDRRGSSWECWPSEE